MRLGIPSIPAKLTACGGQAVVILRASGYSGERQQIKSLQPGRPLRMILDVWRSSNIAPRLMFPALRLRRRFARGDRRWKGLDDLLACGRQAEKDGADDFFARGAGVLRRLNVK